MALRVAATSAAATIVGISRALVSRRSDRGAQLREGDPAPDFALTASNGRVYQLSSYRGKQAVVLAWFPKAFTGGCTQQCLSLASGQASFARYEAAVFGANVDGVETNRRFAASLGLPFPILSDPSRTVARAYGVLGASGFPSRWTFYIGTDGRVLAVDRAGDTAKHGDTLIRMLDALGIPKRSAVPTAGAAGASQADPGSGWSDS